MTDIIRQTIDETVRSLKEVIHKDYGLDISYNQDMNRVEVRFKMPRRIADHTKYYYASAFELSSYMQTNTQSISLVVQHVKRAMPALLNDRELRARAELEMLRELWRKASNGDDTN